VTLRTLPDWLAPSFVLCGLILGGSSSGGIWANLLLQWVAGTLLVVVLVSRVAAPIPRSVVIITAAIGAMLVLQLIPLPPMAWTQLPQRADVAAGFVLAGSALPWLPLSLDPDATLAVLASLLVPAAGLAVFAASSPRALRWGLAALVAAAAVSILLGAAQQIAGEGTALQPYALTNPGMATGLFANRNHLATLLAMAIPCVVLLLPGRTNLPGAAALVALLLGGAVLTGSRAGIALAVIAALLSAVWIHAPARARGVLVAGLGGAAALAAAGGLWLAFADPQPPPGGAEQHRPAMIATTLKAARDHFPAGSGGGSFLRVYQQYEDSAQASPQYRNHAHSDYAEILLEYGAAGALLIQVILAWWAARARAAWRAGPEGAAARCAVIMIGVVLAHSLVDYPLRTGALALLAAGAAIIAARMAEAGQTLVEDRSETPSEDSGHLRITL
jgi:O-antigen ligase